MQTRKRKFGERFFEENAPKGDAEHNVGGNGMRLRKERKKMIIKGDIIVEKEPMDKQGDSTVGEGKGEKERGPRLKGGKHADNGVLVEKEKNVVIEVAMPKNAKEISENTLGKVANGSVATGIAKVHKINTERKGKFPSFEYLIHIRFASAFVNLFRG